MSRPSKIDPTRISFKKDVRSQSREKFPKGNRAKKRKRSAARVQHFAANKFRASCALYDVSRDCRSIFTRVLRGNNDGNFRNKNPAFIVGGRGKKNARFFIEIPYRFYVSDESASFRATTIDAKKDRRAFETRILARIAALNHTCYTRLKRPKSH